MTPIVLDELDRDGSVVRIPRIQAEALASTGLLEVRPELDGQWRLIPSGKVGALRVGDLQVQVTPKEKVGLTRLLFLLGYAADPGFRSEDVAGVEDADLWPALAESLARLAERATGRGVLQGYLTVEDSLRTVRGRIRMSDQISRHPGLMLPIEVTFDDFTVDIPENQILRTAIRRMLAVPRLSDAARSRLAHLDGRLAEVTVLRAGQEVPKWRRSRLNERYAAALRLAEIVLSNASAEAGSGDVTVAAFVVDMAKVFEDFVGTALTEALRRYPGTTRLQYPTHLDERVSGQSAAIPMKVDIVHSVAKTPHLIFDAKYKAAGSGDRYPNADHYQMLAYCTALSVPNAWLVYAGAGETRRRKLRNSPVEVFEYPLDIGRPPSEVLSSIEELARLSWWRAQQNQRHVA